MKYKLIEQLKNTLPKELIIPKELILLYKWIENNNFYIDSENGKRIGFLCSSDEFKGTSIEFDTEDEKDVWYWFDENKNKELKERFCFFARSGADGSMCGLWKSETGEIKIVHIGSGSGSTLLCVLADSMLDFIRLLTIGYDEICWEENFDSSKNKDINLEKNILFENWVKETFNVEIPKSGLEIVKNPATMDDEASEDEFFNWCKGKFTFLE